MAKSSGGIDTPPWPGGLVGVSNSAILKIVNDSYYLNIFQWKFVFVESSGYICIEISYGIYFL